MVFRFQIFDEGGDGVEEVLGKTALPGGFHGFFLELLGVFQVPVQGEGVGELEGDDGIAAIEFVGAPVSRFGAGNVLELQLGIADAFGNGDEVGIDLFRGLKGGDCARRVSALEVDPAGEQQPVRPAGIQAHRLVDRRLSAVVVLGVVLGKSEAVVNRGLLFRAQLFEVLGRDRFFQVEPLFDEIFLYVADGGQSDEAARLPR